MQMPYHLHTVWNLSESTERLGREAPAISQH